MEIHRIIFGFFISTFRGAFVLWFLIDKVAWSYIAKKQNIPGKPSDVLTLPLGIVERTLYTAVLIIGVPEWIAVWSRWQGEERVTYNVFLIGNALSVMFGLIVVWIALGKLPSFTR